MALFVVALLVVINSRSSCSLHIMDSVAKYIIGLDVIGSTALVVVSFTIALCYSHLTDYIVNNFGRSSAFLVTALIDRHQW